MRKNNEGNNSIKPLLSLALSFVLIFGVMFGTTAQAFALTTNNCTAKPNTDSGSTVLGGKETRVTYSVILDETDRAAGLAGLTITFPDNTTFSDENVTVTSPNADDPKNPYEIACSAAIDGQALCLTFNAPTAYEQIKVMVYEVVFPVSGGDMVLTAQGVFADGRTVDLTDVPSIEVTGSSAYDLFVAELEEAEWVQAWNSNTFLRLFLNPPIFLRSLPIVFWGFLMALGIVACAFPLAMPIGMGLALMRISRAKILRGLASFYVNIVRGTPLFLQIYVAFFGLPLAGIVIGNFPLGVIVLAMNSAAYMCEIFRAGIQSIPKGQFEASRSLGMSAGQTMIFVIIPQTVRRVIPTLTSEFILLYKDTSLLAAVGFMEIIMYAKTIVASTGSITPYIVAALFYLAITLPLAKLVGTMEARLAENDTGKASGNVAKKKPAKKELDPADYQSL